MNLSKISSKYFALEEDLLFISGKLLPLHNHLKNKSLLITGATGFFGKWLLLTINYLNEHYELNINTCALSRDPQKFINSYPQFSQINFIKGDVREFKLDQKIDYVIHAATDADLASHIKNPGESEDIIVNGMKNLLKQSQIANASRILNISSGAVYGKHTTPMGEETSFNESEQENSYTLGKRECEILGNSFCDEHNVKIIHARCFAFAGAFLPLDASFAIGNFIDDKLHDREIKLTGDGSPLRSYLYAADLVIWLFNLLLRGKHKEAYNVGSDQIISIKDLAQNVANIFSNEDFIVSKNYESKNQYIPDIKKIKNDLGMDISYDLKTTIERTIRWYR